MYTEEDEKYAIMNDTVDAIVQYIKDNPEKIVFDVNTTGINGIEYWGQGGRDSYITDVWNGRNTERLFSSNQGKRIGDALKEARLEQASVQQKKVIEKMKPKETVSMFKDDKVPTKPVTRRTGEVGFFKRLFIKLFCEE